MIGQGHLDRREFEELLRTLGPADARLLLRRTADGCSLVTLVVTAGRAPAGPSSETYDYGETVLARAVVDGGALADWLSRGNGELAGLTFAVPEPALAATGSTKRAAGTPPTGLSSPRRTPSTGSPRRTESSRTGPRASSPGRASPSIRMSMSPPPRYSWTSTRCPGGAPSRRSWCCCA